MMMFCVSDLALALSFGNSMDVLLGLSFDQRNLSSAVAKENQTGGLFNNIFDLQPAEASIVAAGCAEVGFHTRK